MGVTELLFEFLAHKAKIKGVFDWLYRCYGNLIIQEDDHNMISND